MLMNIHSSVPTHASHCTQAGSFVFCVSLLPFFPNSTYTKMCYFLQNQGASSIYNTRFKDEHKSFSSPIELKNFNSSMDFNSIGELNFPKCFLDIARFPLERINYFYLL